MVPPKVSKHPTGLSIQIIGHYDYSTSRCSLITKKEPAQMKAPPSDIRTMVDSTLRYLFGYPKKMMISFTVTYIHIYIYIITLYYIILHYITLYYIIYYNITFTYYIIYYITYYIIYYIIYYITYYIVYYIILHYITLYYIVYNIFPGY